MNLTKPRIWFLSHAFAINGSPGIGLKKCESVQRLGIFVCNVSVKAISEAPAYLVYAGASQASASRTQ
jgi:hypothetical protein